MTARSLVAFALVIVACSVLQGALDGANLRGPDRRQWRAPGQHQQAVRVPRRHATGIAAESPMVSMLGLVGAVISADCPELSSLVLADVFVPPRT